jgi:hypothetical protein
MCSKCDRSADRRSAHLSATVPISGFAQGGHVGAVAGQPPKASPGARLRLWEFTDAAHCPVIGTCLNHADLLRIARSLKLVFPADAQDYDVHGYFVRAVVADSPEARAVSRLLDERYAGALRLIRRADTEAAQFALWNTMKASSQIAAGFWAFMTNRHVSEDVRGHVFGEVHMLSHLMGATGREQAAQSNALRRELDELQHRRARTEAGLHEAIGARDAQIAELRAELSSLRVRLQQLDDKADAAHREKPVRAEPDDRLLARTRRALETARGRARAAENENRSLAAALDAARTASQPAAVRRIVEVADAPAGSRSTDGGSRVGMRLDGRSFLYVGGRNGQVPYLQRIAETFGAELIHHDGGIEDTVTRIDDVLPSVDCVFCPVDCVSHAACLRAKNHCKKLGKPFIPLRSASKACLRHALVGIMGVGSMPGNDKNAAPAGNKSAYSLK